MNLISRLPQYYLANPAFVRIAQEIATSHCRFSGIFVVQENSMNLLLKDDGMHVPLDWQAFSLIRATTGLFISSGQIIRDEPDVYKSRESYDNKNIDDLYDAFRLAKRQKLFVFTRKLSLEKIRQSVNEKLYEIVQLPGYSSVYNAISQFYADKDNFPLTVEFGVDLVGQYFQDVKKGFKNHIDTLLISKFSTDNIDKKYIGPKFQVKLEDFYDVVWRSQNFPCSLSNGQEGHLTMEIHKLKN